MRTLTLPAVIDGAMATELERRGAAIDDSLWSARALLDSPELIEAVHLDYFAAGADIALTASYQATFAGFAARGIDTDSTREAMRRAVALAAHARQRWRDAAQPPVRRTLLIGASIGAYGAHRHDRSEYHGNYGVGGRVMREFHRRQFEALIATEADFIAFETIPSLAEGEAIVRLLEEYPEVPAWISFSCRDAERVCHGERFRDCVALANEHPGIVAIGLNCTAPRFVEPLLSAAAGVTRTPLFAYPNAGDRLDVAPDAPPGARIDFGAAARRWLGAGAKLIGGCCGTTPDDISRLATIVRPSGAPSAANPLSG